MRILLDTNIWRYLVDIGGGESIYRAANKSNATILACPAVLYEMLRAQDPLVRKRLVKFMCRSRWTRMMPEAFEESYELRLELTRLRPEWVRSAPIGTTYQRLVADWKGSRGVWWRARVDPDRAAEVLVATGDALDLATAREEADERRQQMRSLVTFDNVRLDRWTASFPLRPEGWDGTPVEAWRAATLSRYIKVLIAPGAHVDPAPEYQWLAPWLKLDAIREDVDSFARAIIYETTIESLPRNWVRWAVQTLQATRTTSPGTPVDNQLGSYLVDADVLVTGDKVFAAVAERLRTEAVVPAARPVRVRPDKSFATLTGLLREP